MGPWGGQHISKVGQGVGLRFHLGGQGSLSPHLQVRGSEPHGWRGGGNSPAKTVGQMCADGFQPARWGRWGLHASCRQVEFALSSWNDREPCLHHEWVRASRWLPTVPGSFIPQGLSPTQGRKWRGWLWKRPPVIPGAWGARLARGVQPCLWLQGLGAWMGLSHRRAGSLDDR